MSKKTFGDLKKGDKVYVYDINKNEIIVARFVGIEYSIRINTGGYFMEFNAQTWHSIHRLFGNIFCSDAEEFYSAVTDLLNKRREKVEKTEREIKKFIKDEL